MQVRLYMSGSGWGAEFGASSFWAIVRYRKNIANPQTGPHTPY